MLLSRQRLSLETQRAELAGRAEELRIAVERIEGEHETLATEREAVQEVGDGDTANPKGLEGIFVFENVSAGSVVSDVFTSYDPESAKLARERTLAFFDTNLG